MLMQKATDARMDKRSVFKAIFYFLLARLGVDMTTKAKLLEGLRNLADKLTMVVAAHRISAVANCDQLIDLVDEIPAVTEIAG